MSVRTISVAATTLAAALVLAACGGGDGEETSAAGDSTVTVGALPVMPTAALYVAQDEGFFADHGLEVTVETSQGGAAVIPAVVSGEMEFGTANVISLLQARDQGLDVRIVAHWTSSALDGEDATGLMALPDSGIETAADLEGRTVAVNTLNNIGELAVRGSVRAAGGDDTLVEFVELGFPDMPAALDSGQVDATFSPEPFMTLIEDAGGTIVDFPNMTTIPGMPSQMFFTSGTYADANPEVVAAMTDAINQTLEHAEGNEQQVRDRAVDILDMDPELANRVRMELYGSDLRREQVQATADLAHELGMVEGTPDVVGLMPTE